MVQSQKLLLTWLTNSPALFPKVQRYVGADDFTDPICHSVAKMLFEQYEKDGTVNPARIISTYEDEEQQPGGSGNLKRDNPPGGYQGGTRKSAARDRDPRAGE